MINIIHKKPQRNIMTIQQLTYLLEVHKAGSFSIAAKNLYITQSAISNAIIGLEKEIGSPIFVRSKKGLIPTPRVIDVITQAINTIITDFLIINLLLLLITITPLY